MTMILVRPWSYSSLSMFEACPAQYRFKHMERLPEVQGPAAGRGDAIHKQLETIVKAPTLVIPSMFDKLAPTLRKLAKAPGLECEQSWYFDTNWWPTEGRQDPTTWGIAKLDVKYEIAKTKLGVIDWKTGRRYPANDDQAALYGAIGLARYPQYKTAQTSLIYLDLRERHDEEWTHKQTRVVRDKFTVRVAALELATVRGDFPERRNDKCKWCSYSKTKNGPCKTA